MGERPYGSAFPFLSLKNLWVYKSSVIGGAIIFRKEVSGRREVRVLFLSGRNSLMDPPKTWEEETRTGQNYSGV